MYKPEAMFSTDDEQLRRDKDRTVFSQKCSPAFIHPTGPLSGQGHRLWVSGGTKHRALTRPACGPPSPAPCRGEAVPTSQAAEARAPPPITADKPTAHFPLISIVTPLLGAFGKNPSTGHGWARFKTLLFTEFQNPKRGLSHSQSSVNHY